MRKLLALLVLVLALVQLFEPAMAAASGEICAEETEPSECADECFTTCCSWISTPVQPIVLEARIGLPRMVVPTVTPQRLAGYSADIRHVPKLLRA